MIEDPKRMRKVITKLRFKCAKQLPGIARFALCMPIEVGEILTKIRILDKLLILNEELFSECDEEQLVRAVLQGLFYYILEHKKRSKVYVTDPESRQLWNLASEIAISELLNAMFPRGGHFFFNAAAIGALEKKCVEYYFCVLKDNIEEVKKKLNNKLESDGMEIEDGESADNKAAAPGASGEAADFEGSDTLDGRAGNRDGNQDGNAAEQPDSGDLVDIDSLSKDALQNIIRDAVGRGLYSISEEIRYHAKNLDPRLDRDARKLLSLLRSMSGKGPGVICKGRKPRRKLPEGSPDLVEYSRKGFGKTAVIIDVSGSVHSFLDDIYEAAAKAIKLCANVDVYVGDTTILEKKTGVTSTRQLSSLPIGLGTSMDKIIKEVDSYGYTNIILISDGETAWPENPTRAECVYVPVGPYANVTNVPGWIKIK